MTYSQKLRDPRWQKKRLQILERDNWKCRACGDKNTTLQVHHLIYSKIDPWEYDDRCLQTLCEPCHGLRQRLTDEIVSSLRMAIKNFPNERLVLSAKKMAEAAGAEFDAICDDNDPNFETRIVLNNALINCDGGRGKIGAEDFKMLVYELCAFQMFGVAMKRSKQSYAPASKLLKEIASKMDEPPDGSVSVLMPIQIPSKEGVE